MWIDLYLAYWATSRVSLLINTPPPTSRSVHAWFAQDHQGRSTRMPCSCRRVMPHQDVENLSGLFFIVKNWLVAPPNRRHPFARRDHVRADDDASQKSVQLGQHIASSPTASLARKASSFRTLGVSPPDMGAFATALPVHRILKRLARLELRSLGSRDLDGFAGLRVAASARSAF